MKIGEKWLEVCVEIGQRCLIPERLFSKTIDWGFWAAIGWESWPVAFSGLLLNLALKDKQHMRTFLKHGLDM
jgi:hypothetical protein